MAVSTVVIAGGGLVGVPLAYRLKERLHGQAEVIVVSDQPELRFVPANPWLALGLRAEQEVTFALEPLHTARKIQLKVQALRAIAPEERRVRLADGSELRYDVLVLATGIRPDWRHLPGAEENPRVHSVIRPADALAAHKAYLQFLKEPGPLIIAAAARVPTIGPMYEYAFLADADLRRRSLRDRIPITLVTPEPYPGHVGLDRPIAREQLTEALAAQGITWIGNADLQDCRNRQLRAIVHEDTRTSERRWEFAYAVIWPRFRGVDAVASCAALCDEDGLLIVDEYQRVRGRDDLYALGACTSKSILTDTPVPVGAPDAVYVGQQQVAVVARNIEHWLKGEPPVRANIEREQWIADAGKRGAAHMAAPQVPLRDIQWLRQGRWVYEAKRQFENYYVNQILFEAGPHGHVAALIRRLRSATVQARMGKGAAALGTHLEVSVDVHRNLEALARQLGVNADALARQLLEKAVDEAMSCLDPETRTRVQTEVQRRLLQELDTNQERVRFEGGAP